MDTESKQVRLSAVGIVAISLFLVPLNTLVGDWVLWVNWVAMGAALVLTVVTGIDYLWQAWRGNRSK